MDWLELILTIGLIVFVTILYFVLRKFISWAIDDNNNFYKKRGHRVSSKETLKCDKQIAYDKLTQGYLLVLFVLVLYIIKVICDSL